jgi:glycosyltransferase involved in cell wall biosynthesis
MKVLLTSASFAAEYGGPALSVSRLGVALAKEGVEVGLWAPDGSALSSNVVQAEHGVRPLSGSASNAIDTFGALDILHDSGIWLPHNHALAMLSGRGGGCRIVSTRGMLEPWAIRYKAVKKRLAWHLYQKHDLLCADRLHATSVQEAEQLAALGLKRPIDVVPNGMDLPSENVLGKRRACPERIALFLSRIHPKKGLPMLVEAWARLRPEGWRLVISGPSELGHADEIAQEIQRFGIGDMIKLIGPQYGEDKMNILLDADLFVLPTHSENFGMAVAEALAYGLPVLTTTGAPWQEIAVRRCGWWVAPEVDPITNALYEALQTSDHNLRAMGARGRALIAAAYGWQGVATRMIENYQVALSTRHRRYTT